MKRSLAYLLIPLPVLFLTSVFFAYPRMRRWRISTGTEGMFGEAGIVKRSVVRALESRGSTDASQP